MDVTSVLRCHDYHARPEPAALDLAQKKIEAQQLEIEELRKKLEELQAHRSAPPSPPPASSALPTSETARAVHDLWQCSSSALDPTQQQQLQQLLWENADSLTARDEDCKRTGLVQHSIDTGPAPPIRLRPYQLTLAKPQAAEEQIRNMVAARVIEPSDSPWAAPAVLVKKKDDSWRFCMDYQRLNAVTRKDSYPLPRIDNVFDCISGSKWFSSLDLRSGYWQVELAPDARHKTTFTIGQGLWQFCVMPFRLCNTPVTFERLMERVLSQVPKRHCIVYLDDLLVHTSDFEGAPCHLRKVFAAIHQAGLRLNPKKCQLFRRETAFLGHVVSAGGVATDPAKIAAVHDWPPPTNVSNLWSFLGLASYYHRSKKCRSKTRNSFTCRVGWWLGSGQSGLT
ncbi:hypothetical protein AAFF_G00189770 [Aldrovandia affinis]|uniref:ribonuclease H n=1 Tax=Aldrovandia affinis TaxID=143900 RepID=A0AAD7RM69_9TELE|nr:hypothetical protein AAFF_G00189770 [Aldrovandia affinis]